MVAVSGVSHAQLAGDSTGPGDSCAGFPSGATRMVADSDSDFASVVLVCDGSNWQSSNSGLWVDNSSHISYRSAHIINPGETLPLSFASAGTRMFFYPDKAAFSGGYLSSWGVDNDRGGDANIGDNSFTWGIDSKASGSDSVAMGDSVVASGFNGSTAFGWFSTASGRSAFTAGAFNEASGFYSVALGYVTYAMENYSTAIGYANTANADYSTALGGNNSATGNSAITLGNETSATGSYSQTFGRRVTSGGNTSVAFGLQSASHATQPTVTGDRTIAFINDGGVADANSGLDITASDAFIIHGANVGIGDDNPSVELDVVGDINYTGTITDASDIRLKAGVEDLPAGQLDNIMGIDGVSFYMKSDPTKAIEYGFIAQDVQEHYPHLVKEDNDGMLSVSYIGLIAPLLEAVKEQQEVIEDLEGRIGELEKQMATREE